MWVFHDLDFGSGICYSCRARVGMISSNFKLYAFLITLLLLDMNLSQALFGSMA